MALDDQLAALAAGELDDDAARALRARAAADPALARTLARHEQLQRLLTDWDAPAMPEEAAGRLAARVDEALAALDDEPLADRTTAAAPPAAVDEARSPDAGPRQSSQSSPVVDLDHARRRRGSGDRTTGWPSWGAGAAVAAALAAIVGTGIVLTGLSDGESLDVLAGGGAEESAEDSAEMMAEDDTAGSDQAAQSGGAEAPTSDEAAEEEAADGDTATAEERAPLAPARVAGVELAEGDLLALVDLARGEADSSEPAAAGDDTSVTCVEEALRRDTAQSDDREVWLVADGSYAGRDAAFVVVRSPLSPHTTGSSGEDRYEVLAYDPADCSLLARDETSR